MFAKIINLYWKLSSSKIINRIGKRGENVIIGTPIDITKPENLQLGNHVYIGPNAWISTYGTVQIMTGTIIGPRLKIYTGNHNYNSDRLLPYDEITIAKNVTIKENVWIGGDVTILPGITIEEGAIVGASSVVTKDVPKGAIIGGNPAKILKYRDLEKYDKLKQEGKIYLQEKTKTNLKMVVKNYESNI
ncbi:MULTISPECIES: acyltransferase [Chryseobacterium]|uniref:acyltransferase n=1 Tax=Chryseobacterium TaxID=59732 RepID=UPI0024A708C7|nr:MULTISPECIES: acyltransferase [Chryseobacterium]MEA1848726.1 acyltransferase [Chryseobacterium sp. MHB01]MEC5174864.1 maltose O-acetyltransferase [Chryseobacterium nepalense]